MRVRTAIRNQLAVECNRKPQHHGGYLFFGRVARIAGSKNRGSQFPHLLRYLEIDGASQAAHNHCCYHSGAGVIPRSADVAAP
jgi:hypothetical protein